MKERTMTSPLLLLRQPSSPAFSYCHTGTPNLRARALQVKHELNGMRACTKVSGSGRRTVIRRESVRCGIFSMMIMPIQENLGHDVPLVGRGTDNTPGAGARIADNGHTHRIRTSFLHCDARSSDLGRSAFQGENKFDLVRADSKVSCRRRDAVVGGEAIRRSVLDVMQVPIKIDRRHDVTDIGGRTFNSPRTCRWVPNDSKFHR